MTKNFKKYVFLILPILFCNMAIAQVTGTVTDVNGPLFAATVSVKGTSNGVATDFDGKYSLQNVNSNDVLVFSSQGYKPQEVTYTGQNNIDVVLVADVSELDPVVVVGYGAQKKSVVTGAISSIDAKQFASASNQRVEQVLQGRTSGVTVTSQSGSPGSGSKVAVRGVGSSGNAGAIFIVDGLKVRSIDFIPPSDIESIEVLKDAASTAIYGTEGANGVIIISTKKGKKGTPSITFNTQFGFDSLNTKAELLNAQQFVQYNQEAGRTQIVDNGVDTDWLKETFQDATNQRYDLSVSGASDTMSYFFSGSRLDQEGLVGGDNSGYERNALRANITARPKTWLELGLNMSYVNSKNNTLAENGDTRGIVQNALILDPLTPLFYEDGQVPQSVIDEANANAGGFLLTNGQGRVYGYPTYSDGEVINPVAYADALSTRTQRNDNLLTTVYATVKPIAGLELTTRYGYDRQSGNVAELLQPYYVSPEAQNTVFSLNEVWFGNSRWLWENFASYTRDFGKHNGKLLVGYSAEQNEGQGINANASTAPADFTDPFFSFFRNFSPTNAVSGGRGFDNLVSNFARFNYNYDEKYLAQVTYRSDRSDKFPIANRTARFYSASAGWVISQEEFWNADSQINFLKLRGSWGQNGSKNNVPGNQERTFITVTDNGTGITYEGLPGISISGLPNSNLVWETSEQTDFGIDLRALNNRLTFTTDYYIKTTRDLIISDGSLITPGSAGFNFGAFNGGTVENRGFEFELGYQDQTTSGFRYAINANLSTLRNRVTDIKFVEDSAFLRGAGAPQNPDGVTRFQVGAPVWYFYGYRTEGINPATGEVIYADTDGSGTITPEDKTNIGNALPNLIYGGNINLGFKGFDFNVQFQGVSGNDVFSTYHQPSRPITNKPLHFFTERWTQPGDIANYPAAQFAEQTYQSDLVVEDASYMRIKQLQLGYALSDDLSQRLSLSTLRLYVSLDDYFTFTKFRGIDPEVGNFGFNQTGVDPGTNPVPAKLIFGLSAKF